MPLSTTILTSILTAVQTSCSRSGVNQMWILRKINRPSGDIKVRDLVYTFYSIFNTFDLSTLYYDFRIKTMYGSSLPPVVCRRDHVLFTLFVFFACSGVQHILCYVLICFSSSCVPYVASFSGLSIVLLHLQHSLSFIYKHYISTNM